VIALLYVHLLRSTDTPWIRRVSVSDTDTTLIIILNCVIFLNYYRVDVSVSVSCPVSVSVLHRSFILKINFFSMILILTCGKKNFC
jgi:hypothetical protein